MAGPPLSIADVLGRPSPAPRQPVTGRTISDILGEPIQAPAPVVRPRPQPRPAPVRSISDILGSPSPAPVRPLGPPPVAPTLGLTTFDEGVQRGEASYVNGPELTPAPSPSPAQARRQPWQGPMVPKARETRAQRAKRETEALERESAWSNFGIGPIANPLQNPVQSVSDILARPVRWAGQALAQAQEVGSRTLAPVVNSILGDAAAQLTQKTAEGLSKVGEATLYSQVPAAGSRLFVPDGVDPQAWYETQQEYPQLGRPAQIRLAQERARANLLKTYQGEDILGPRSRELMQTSPTGQAIAKGEQAARADVAARPDENWAQSLTGLLKGVPGAYMFDEKAETMGQAALRRNPDAPIGAAALEMLAPNPLAMVPGASLARLDKLGKLGLAMRGAANLTGVATGVGSEIPVQLAKLAGKGLLKGVGQVGQAVERIGEGESTLARLARLASLPAGEARPGEIMALLRGLRNPASPASVSEVLGRPAPDVAQLERLGDNAAANFQGNQRARPGMARLAQAEQGITPAARPVEAPPVVEAPAPAALAPEPVRAPAAPEPLPDTRGQGVQYHGSSRPVGALEEGHYETQNIYGQGFYSTDALDVAESYTKKGSKRARSTGELEPSLYEVRERQPVNFFDLDGKLVDNPEVSQTFREVLEAQGHGDALTGLSGRATFAEVLDEMRHSGAPADEIQEAFDSLQWQLRDAGFGGWKHVGGRLTGNTPPHQVKIYFDPAQQVELVPKARAGTVEASLSVRPAPEAPAPVTESPLAPAVEAPAPAPAPVVRPPAEPRPADLGPGGETLETLSPHDLKADAKAYQFKSGGDFEGVTERLRDVRKWDRSKSGKAIVHERLNGDRYVADGHQRLGLARRLADQGQDPQIDALVFREAEGYTVEDMRVIAAAKNMAEDSGTAVDAAKIIKAYGIDSPHIDSIPRSSAVMRDGEQLAKLGDEAFEQVINGVIPQSHAAHVGRLISDPAEQAGAIRALARYAPESSSEALAIVNDIRVEGMATRTEQGGLFGPETFAEDLIGERGKIFAGTESLAKKDKTLFAAVVRGEKEFSQAGNVLAGDVNRAKITDAQRILAGLEEAKYRGPVNAKLNELARELKAGNTTVAAASRSFLETVRAESEVSAAAGLRGSGQAAAAAVPEPRQVEGFREPEPEPVPDIEGQDTLFSVPTGSRGRLASSPSTPANSPLPGPEPTPARLAGPAPATATAPAAPLDPKRSWWAKLWDKPREARVKSQMALTRELQDTLGMLARDEHLRPPSLFERAQSTLQGGTSPRVVYGPGSPTRPGGGAPQKATGAYHQGRDLLEVRDPGASGTVYHEAGHAIDTHTEFVKNAPPPIAAELERLGDPATPMPRTGGQSSWQPGMSKLRKRQEGMAEFLRLWMAHPDFDLAAQYPELSKAWESFLDGSNDVGRRLRRHQADMTVRLRSEAQGRVRAQVVEEDLTNSWGVNDALASGFDRFRWMEALDSTLARNAKRALNPDESVYVTTRMLAGLDSVMGSWIRGAPIGFNREAVAGAKSLESIFEPLADNPQQFLDFRDYLIARRADELHGRDMKSGMSPEDVTQVRADLEAAHPHFEQMAQDVYAWNDNILQYAADAGFLSESALKSIREMNQNYVPFHRIYETAAQEFGLPKGTGGGLQASDTIKAIKGSNREIVDPIETMMANAAALISNAEKNRVGKILLQHWDQRSEGIGHFVREVSEPQRLVTADASDVIQVKQMREALEQAGVPTDGMSPEQLSDLIDLLPQIKIFEKSGQLPANTVKVKVQVPQKVVDPVTGAETTTTVDRWRLVEMEPHLYTAFSALDEDQVHWAVNALSGVANLLRAGATRYSPVFAINNAIRDSIEASTISRLGTRTSGALRPLEPLVHAAHGMRVVIGHSLAKFLEGGLTGALEEAGRFVGLPGKLPAGVRAVTDRIKMDAPAAVKRVDELMETFIREGGMQGMDDMLTSEAGTRAAYNRVFGRLNPKSRLLTYVPQGMRPYLQGAFDLATLPIRTPAAVIRILSEASEQMNRVSEFEKGLKVIAEANPTWSAAQVRRQAAFEARDLLDFSVRGSQMRSFRRMVPFLGSQMTGNYRVAKTVLEGVSQGRGWGSLGPSATRMFTQAAASITLPTMMLYAMNRNDADYNQLPQEERDTFWHLRVGKGTDDFLRIAKPHFLGATFASAPERFMQWGLQNDPDAFHGFLEAMVKHTMGPFGAPLQLAASDKPFAERFAGAADILGPAGKTLLELATNHDFFRNRAIEPKWNRDPDSSAYLPSYMRSDEYSSLVARTLARSPIGRAVGVSPLQLDHAMGNLAGTGGRLVVSAELDPLLAALGAGEPPKAKTRKWGGLGYSESRYASEERLKREYTQTRDAEAEAMAKEQDLPPAQQDRIDLVRDTLKEVKDLRKQLREATGQEAADLRMEIRRITAAVTPPPGGRP